MTEEFFTEIFVVATIDKASFSTSSPIRKQPPRELGVVRSFTGRGYFVKNSSGGQFKADEIWASFKDSTQAFSCCKFSIIQNLKSLPEGLEEWPVYSHVVFMEHDIEVFLEMSEQRVAQIFSTIPWTTHDLVWHFMFPKQRNASVNIVPRKGPYISDCPPALFEVIKPSGVLTGYANLDYLVARKS